MQAGTRVGAYEVVAKLGEGGMGEVYRARDTKLQRDVALKILPAAFASDPDRLARFEREARTLAALNHPHIAQIYGFEQANGVSALAMELVEGEDLAQRLARGPLPLDEALPIARQIAEALEAAHEQGIIHRDLKPANVKVRDDGTVKVLDFGLAKALEQRSGIRDQGSGIDADVSAGSPTITTPAMMTMAGMILGTAAYMSPEQAKGKPADKRSDIWAFGCVLYEMLAGRRVFDGEDVTETIAAVVRAQPDWTALPPQVPAPVRSLLQGCLKKDRRERIGDVSTVLFLLKEPWNEAARPTANIASRQSVSLIALSVVATAAIVGAAALAMSWRRNGQVSAPVVRFAILLNQQGFNSATRPLAISPDGSRIAYVATLFPKSGSDPGISQLFVRPLADLEAHAVSGASIPMVSGVFGTPFFSPDGQWVGFYSNPERAFKKIAVDGGKALTICNADTPSGASWDGDSIVFGQRTQGIMRVAVEGGQPETIVKIEPSQTVLSPQLIDGGRSVLFTLAEISGPDQWDKADIVVQSLGTGRREVVVHGGADARALNGRLVYAIGNALWSVPFDEQRGQPNGIPNLVLDGVSRSRAGTGYTGFARYALSTNGTLAYVPGSLQSFVINRALAMGDAAGHQRLLSLPPQPYLQPRFSPDGKRLAFNTDDGKEAAVWIVDDLDSGARPRRLTFDGRNLFPIWSPDGVEVVYQSDREGDRGLFRQRADGSRPAERLTKADPGAEHTPTSFAPDGRTLAFQIQQLAKPSSIWTLSMGDGKIQLFGTRGVSAYSATFSPDGHWLAYAVTLAAGAPPNVFLQPFPPTGAMYQVSINVGAAPAWSPDATTIYYLVGPSEGGRLYRVGVRTTPTVTVGQPTSIDFRDSLLQNQFLRPYDVSPNGKEFAMVVSPQNEATRAAMPADQINVVLNWFEELRQKAPVK